MTSDKGDLRIKSLEFALQWSKQITTLATGTLVISATFIKDIFQGKPTHSGLIIVSWICMAMCAVLGIFFIGSVTAISAKKDDPEKIDVYSTMNRILAVGHVLVFIGGLVCFMLFAVLNI